MNNQAQQRLTRVCAHLTMSSPSTAPPNLAPFNALPAEQLTAALLDLCHSTSWVDRVVTQRPYQDLPHLIHRATAVWYDLGASAWREAFAGHGTLGVKTAEQQSAMASASNTTITAIQQANTLYETKHHHKCITFAAGKSSERLLKEVVDRTPLSVQEEMRRCAEQTMLITALRLSRFVHGHSSGSSSNGSTSNSSELRPTNAEIQIVSPLTTHILDTSLGVPAEGVTIRMERRIKEEVWIPVATGSTNKDGRVTDLLPGFYDSCHLFQAGVYRLTFDTDGYYSKLKTKCFYPNVVISFYVEDPSQHYHVPLLLNPYGYSTYRGS